MTNKEIVLEYLDVVFNKRDLAKAETFWAGDMIQHNPAMPNGLDVLRGFITSPDPSPSQEASLAMEDGDKVMVHNRYKNWFGKDMIAVDIFRLENGKIVEHWDVMQEEVPADKAVNGHEMFPIPAPKNDKIQVIGNKFIVDFQYYKFELFFESETKMTFTSLQGENEGYSEQVDIQMIEIRPNVYMVSWQEKAGNNVVHLEDYENGVAYTNITVPSLDFYRLKGTLTKKA
ncbi:MAG: nuclear transport factor 2 family protein [Capnocytophaga sp.]|nr:nuclear transport factor 2 family protein [Capnocytophaga sp.]